jgi:hypothetical protein
MRSNIQAQTYPLGRTSTPSEWSCISPSARIIEAWFAVAVCNMPNILRNLAWRLAETVRHAISRPLHIL